MNKKIQILAACFLSILLLAACSRPSAAAETYSAVESSNEILSQKTASPEVSGQEGVPSELSLQDRIEDTYYAGQNAPAYDYFQHSSIQRFLAMWVKEETGDIEKPEWNLDSFTELTVLDHDFEESRADEQLYCCTFSNGADRYGYAIVKYSPVGPSMGNWSIAETTPYQFDLKPDMEKVLSDLAETDIDLETVEASRVYLFDKDQKRADQVIRFTDGKGDNYIYYFGDPSCKIEKW